MSNETIQMVVESIAEHFIATGEASTSAEIAERLGISKSRVYDTIGREGFWGNVDPTKKVIRVMSRDYPDMVQSTRSVNAFLPSHRRLAECVKEARK